MKRLFVVAICLVVTGMIFAACSGPAPSSTSEPFQKPTVTTPATFTLTPTSTETPLPTPTPSVTPLPTATSTPEPRRQVLINYAWCCGDGISSLQLFFLGYSAPRFILYPDGQFIVRQGYRSNLYQRPGDEVWGEGYSFAEGTLSEAAMCGLLDQITSAGFFEIAEEAGDIFAPSPSLYTFDTEHGWPLFGEGSPDPTIVVNGEQAAHISILDDWLDYLQPGMAGVYSTLDTYRHRELEAYVSDRVALLIGRRLATTSPEDERAQWPADLPPLADLFADALQFGESDAEDERVAIVEGASVTAILDLFDNRLRGQRYMEGEWHYYVIARPMLPHETSANLRLTWLVNPEFTEETYTLPFTCEE